MESAFGYIMANRHRTIYIGVTNDLQRRVWQHKIGLLPGFTRKYQCHHLVFYAEFAHITHAIEWEQGWKKKTRAKKMTIIAEMNPNWNDLAWPWFDEHAIVDERTEIAEAVKRGEIP